MKKLSVLSLCLVLCTLLSACSAGTVAGSKAESAPSVNDFYYSSVADGAEMEKVVFDDALNYGTTESATGGSVIGQAEQKLVYTSNVTLETEDFEAANQSLHSKISALGGIIVSESANNLSNVGYRSLSLTVRIPQKHYDAFLSGLSETYNVASIYNNVENLTERYYDTENRLKSYRIQEERLFSMLEKAGNVKEMLEIESRLCDVQYQIESLTNVKNTIDNDVKYATFYLHLNEVRKYTSPTPKTFGDRLGETISDSAETFLEFLEGALFTGIYLAPYLLILLVILIFVLGSVKASRKKKLKKESESKPEK